MCKKIKNTENYVVLLGTKGGPAIRFGSTNPTSSLLVINDKKIVIDCGLGVTKALVNQGMKLKELGLIFITHLHSDHYLELGPLLHTAWCSGLQNQVEIYGPPGLKAYWNNFILSMKDDIDLRIKDEGRPNLMELIKIRPIKVTTPVIKQNLTVTAMKNKHPPLIHTFALSFKTEKFHIVFSGDTTYLPELANFSKDADLLIHEAMLKSALKSLCERVTNTDERLMSHLLRSHTMAEDVGKIATKARVKALALNHLIPSDDPNFMDKHWYSAIKPFWNGPLYIGKDNLRIELP